MYCCSIDADMAQQTRVLYRTKSNDFVVLVDSTDAVHKYRKDSSTPLIDVVDSYDVFVTNKHGAQGVLDRASNGQIENEFGTYFHPEWLG